MACLSVLLALPLERKLLCTGIRYLIEFWAMFTLVYLGKVSRHMQGNSVGGEMARV
jgi:hypothetical protein